MSEVLVTDEEIAASHAAFAATEFGQRLANSIRYARYKPTSFPKESWTQLLGADVNNLEHMPLTRGLARDFIRTTNALEPGRITPEDAALLEVSAMVHDRGEAIIPDITASLKTSEDESKEQAAFRKHNPRFGKSSPGVQALIKRAIEEVIFTKETPQGQMLSAVEHVGYMRTALRAGQIVAERSAPYYLDRGLRWLTVDVLTNVPPKLRTYGQIFPAVDQYVQAKEREISSLYVLLEDESNCLPYGAEFRAKCTAFANARFAWNSPALASEGAF